MHKFIHFRNPKENTSSAAAEHVEVKLEPNENDDVEMLEDYGEIKVYVVHVFYSVSFYIGHCFHIRLHTFYYVICITEP